LAPRTGLEPVTYGLTVRTKYCLSMLILVGGFIIINHL
jgi:hypothetical protein